MLIFILIYIIFIIKINTESIFIEKFRKKEYTILNGNGKNIMKKVLEQFLERNNINLCNKNICVGVSTGIDSSVLLHILMELKEKYNFNIIVCHVNHGKREQSNIEEQYIIDFSKKNNLTLELLHLDLQEIENNNFQSAARIKRLTFFNDVMNKHNSEYLFLAHHLNDDIETSLMHIIRGSNLKGYGGIEEVITNNDNKTILRPLLSVLKEDIIQYGKDNNVKFFEDDSNNSDCYTRNRVRHNIVPLLFKENESFDKQFLDFKDTIFNSYQIVCEQRDQYILENVIIKDDIILNVNSFNMLSNFMKSEVLFELLKKYEFSKANIKELIKLIESSKPNLIINYKNIVFSKQYNRVIIKENNDIFNDEQVEIVIDHVGNYYINDKYYLEVKWCSIDDLKKNENSLINLNVIWYNSSMLPIVLRNRKNGDRIKINDGTKKVKDLLIDEKIPVSDRDNLLLLAKNDEVINIFGVKKGSTLLSMEDNDILITLREKETC